MFMLMLSKVHAYSLSWSLQKMFKMRIDAKPFVSRILNLTKMNTSFIWSEIQGGYGKVSSTFMACIKEHWFGCMREFEEYLVDYYIGIIMEAVESS
ncbi:hypothetical protein V6N13_054469 [Hibiscus sabdariffa]